jgi:hypothetical protein
MSPQEFEIAKELWKAEYAYASFNSVKDGIRSLSDGGFKRTSPEYDLLSVGIICLYSRPFTRGNAVGKISDSVVPKGFIDLHGHVLTLRDKIFAHSDGDALLGPDQYMNAVQLRKRHGKVALYMTKAIAEPEFFERLMPLVDALIKKTNQRRSLLLTQLQPHIPKTRDGYFRVNILDQAGPVFIKIEDNSPGNRARP